MKIIDLLNKIANDEEVPRKFTYKGYLWEYDVKNKMWFYYFGESKNHRFDRLFYLNMILNDEVEILEEEPRDIEVCGSLFTRSEYDKLAHSEEEKKIPEKLEIEQDTPSSNYYIRNEYGTKCGLTKHSKMIAETLNEVIDYLKSKGE